jgi:hypothetical protein
VWVRAAEGLDEAGFAAFRQGFGRAAEARVEGHGVEVAVDGLRGRLRLVADVAAGERLAVEGGEPGSEGALLAVNGRDVGREILGEVGVVARYQRLLDAAAAGAAGAPKAGEPFEAEAAALVVPPFRIDADAAASGGKFLWMPGEPGGRSGSGVARAAWLVHVPAAGEYRLWARVRTPTPEDDSFFVRVEQAGREAVPTTAWHTGQHQGWAWSPVAAGVERRPLAARLNPGVAVVEFRCREDGARLDRLVLTADPAWRPPE